MRRALFDTPIDRFRFTLDRLPSLGYQPLPWLGLNNAARAAGVVTRWDRVSAHLQTLPVESSVDIGCNAGYFPIQMGLRGVTSLGIENNPRFFRLFQYAIARLNLQNVAAVFGTVNPATTFFVPPADAVFFLAVWHHVVRVEGRQAADRLLEDIWKRTNVVLFFETGEGEMPPDYRLPDMGSDPTGFIGDHLASICRSSRVEFLGRHAAFAPDKKTVERSLFAVTRA